MSQTEFERGVAATLAALTAVLTGTSANDSLRKLRADNVAISSQTYWGVYAETIDVVRAHPKPSQRRP